MRKLTLWTSATAVLSAVIGSALADSTYALVAVAATTPAAVVAPAATLNAAGEGRRLYLKLNCYGCHGMAATGGMGPNIVRAELGDLSEALREGEDSGMRSFATYVTATDIANIAAYLRSIGTSSEPKFRDWWVPVPTK